jgi:hypothetical protein
MDKIKVLVINDSKDFANKLSDVLSNYPIISADFISSADSFISTSLTEYNLILLDFVLSKEDNGRVISGTCRPIYDYILKTGMDCILMTNNSKKDIPSHFKKCDIWGKKHIKQIPYKIMERFLKKHDHVN